MSKIKTSRLYLRPMSSDDATQVYADWLNDPEVNRYLETRHNEQTRLSCRNFIESCNADEGSHLFGIFHRKSNLHIGNAKIGFVNSEYQRGQVSLFIGEKQFWGQGLSSELVCALTEFGFNTLGLNRLEAGCYEDNQASLRVFLKAGYKVEGFMRDQVTLDGKRTGCYWLGVLARDYA